ncbi:hypothetical protein WA026_016786 [Henosepilachna vigintioctopunctata]|uniref:Uncharacterized protein n=1 Tax=Henosepilachna vigintioctopunctata TaxID=420089 RepID=A0AAW1V042_9CUCU
MTAVVGEVIARPNQQPTVDIINENSRPDNQQPSDMSNKKENSDNEKTSSLLNAKSNKIRKVRNAAKVSLDKQAEKMLTRSNAKFPIAEIGQSVRLRIPDVDRAKKDRLNIISIIISVEKEKLINLELNTIF